MGNRFKGKHQNGSANNPEMRALFLCPQRNNLKTGVFKLFIACFWTPKVGDSSISSQSVPAKILSDFGNP